MLQQSIVSSSWESVVATCRTTRSLKVLLHFWSCHNIFCYLQFHERDFTLRTRDSHNMQCNRLADNPHYSKTYGINSNSVLNKSRFYHVVGGMPPDAMHDILEGVLHYSVKETLKTLILDKNYITLDELNKRITSFDYGYHNDSNKPAEIQRSRLLSDDHSLKQHGK